ncbi:MAG: hypothetical protein CVT83_01225 [Alphaproteobacteria bacterium HGW-Alphaproteobacteria-5]|nr:MAG: hypothetical protein CVT83_01225 [Alphaproteobacteria bacterium HGW-Alphaproteobacteria-5]
MITGPQCRAARALVEINRVKLAKRSGVRESVIAQFERKSGQLTSQQVEAIIHTLEGLGAVFLDEDDQGIGVRLKFTNADARQIAQLEGEGGIIASDRVP